MRSNGDIHSRENELQHQTSLSDGEQESIRSTDQLIAADRTMESIEDNNNTDSNSNSHPNQNTRRGMQSRSSTVDASSYRQHTMTDSVDDAPRRHSLGLADSTGHLQVPGSPGLPAETNGLAENAQPPPCDKHPISKFSPHTSPSGSPRLKRQPTKESRRISITEAGSWIKLNQYKLKDEIGKVCTASSLFLWNFPLFLFESLPETPYILDCFWWLSVPSLHLTDFSTN